MPPKAASTAAAGAVKRKRGRPPTASNASPQSNDEVEHDAENQQPQKKRGRPRKSTDSAAAEASPAAPKPRRSGRSSLEGTAEGKSRAAMKAGQEEPMPKKRPGRPSLNKDRTGEMSASTTTRSRQRRKKQASTAEASPATKIQAGEPRRSGRQRNSLQDLSPSQANNAAAPRKTTALGKPSRRASAGSTKGTQRARKAGRGRPSLGDRRRSEGRASGEPVRDEDDYEDVSDNDEGSQHNSSRMDQSVAEDDEDELGLPPKPFLHVASRVRGVKQSTIDARWSPLGASSIRAASTTLTLAYRPVMQRLSGTTQRRLHASSALALVYKRVTRKLTRGLPFPPATVVGTATRAAADDAGREAELDFESVLDGARALGRQLDPALHAVELLRREKERLERELELDYKNLQNLEAAASGQAREQRQLLKKAHVLAPGASVPRDQDVEMIFDEDDASVPPGSAFKDLDDDLNALALQLGDHMDSIKANMQQVDGLQPQVAATRAALRTVLARHLDPTQYEKAVLGS